MSNLIRSSAVTTDTDASKPLKRRDGRSPAYPFIPIQKALEKIAALYGQEKAHAAPLASALSAWGYSVKSSGGRQTLATMKYYGLVEITGEGDARMVKVSEMARRILLDTREDDTEKRALIREVALMPVAHKTLYQKYNTGLASDGTVRHFLTVEKGFNEDAAKELLAEFKQTASFIGLYQPDNRVDKLDELDDDGDDEKPPSVKVGDKVQVTVAGVDTFPDGATVLGFSDDGAWVYTDQSSSAAKLEEVTLIEAVVAPPIVERPLVPDHLLKRKDDEAPKGSRRAVFPLDEGDVALVFPEGLSSEGLKELGQYLDIFLKKEVKKAGSKPN